MSPGDATDEPHHAATDPRGYEDVPPEARAKMKRHVAIGNLEFVGDDHDTACFF